MITFLDENDVEYGALATIKATNAVNGERSLTGTIVSGDYVLSNIERGWRLRFDDEYYVVTYAKPVDEGRDVQVEFDAVHQFFWDFDKSSVYDQLADGSHTFIAYLDFIFKNSGYSYTVDSALNVHAFEKQSFGFKKRLTLFNDIITSTGVEFQVNGKVVRILEKVGTDLSTVVRKNFNMNELTIEKNIGDFVTYQKGFGAYFDEEDHSKGRLEVEYTSPLANVYGKLEAEPFVDERYSQSGSLLAVLKKNVDNSYTISVALDMEDLTRAGYKYKQPVAGDYIMAINETLGFKEKIRIVSFTSEYDVAGQLIKHTVTCNDIGSVKKLSAGYNLTKKQASSASATANNAYSVANKALISADGKNTNYYGDTFPVDNPKGTLKTGDLLFLTIGDTVKQYYWNGADWVINPVLDDVEAFKEQINEELKDVPNREEFENKISEELAASKAEITTQIETAKTQAESNAKEYADTINQETAKVAELANAAAGEIKADLVNVKNNLTDTSLVANNAQAAVDAAKQELTEVANELSTAKQDLTNSVAEVNTKVNSTKAELTQAKQDLISHAQQLQTQANAQTELSKRVTTVETTANGTKTTVSELSKTVAQNGKDITSVTARTKVVEDDLSGTKTTLSQVKTTADSASQKTATLESGLNGLSAKFENLQIGTKNILRNTSTIQLDSNSVNYAKGTWQISSGGNGTAQVFDIDDAPRAEITNAVRIINNTNGENKDIAQRYVPVEFGEQYTVSCWARVSAQSDTDSVTLLMRCWTTSAVNRELRTAISNTEWKRYTLTFTTESTDNHSLQFGQSGGGVIEICGMQLEKGNIVSDYSENDWDLSQKVAEYKQTADQNYARLQSNLQTLDGTVKQNKSEFDQTASQIKSSISAVEGKIPTEAGLRNYVLGTGTAKTSTGGKLYDLSSAFDNIAAGATLIIEFDWSVTAPTNTSKFRINRVITYSDGTADQWSNIIYKDGVSSDIITSSGSGHFSGTFGNVTYNGTTVSSRYLNLNQSTDSGTVTISNLSVRVGSLKSDWQPAPEDAASQISNLSSQIKQTADGMTLLATKTELNTAKSDLQSGITTATNKANSNAQTISTHTTQISALNTGLQAKVSQTDFNTLSGRVTTAENNITAKANELSSKITSVEGKIPTNVSTRNLILKSNDLANPHKQNGDKTTVTSTNDYFVIRSTGYTANGWGGISWNMSISEVKAGEVFSILMPVYIDSSIPLDNGFNFNIKNHPSNIMAYNYGIPTNKKDQWFNVAITFKISGDVKFDTYPFYVYLVKNGLVRIKPPMLVRGNLIPSDYQPAFEDTVSDVTKLNTTLTQTSDGLKQLSTKVTSQGNTITSHTNSINSLTTGLNAKVSQTEFNTLSGRVTTAENNITAKANELSSKITSVEGKIPSGEMNLVEYGRPANGYSPYVGAEYATHGFYYNGAFKMYVIRNWDTSEKLIGMNRFKVERNTDYTLYFKGFNDSTIDGMDVWFLKRVNGSTNDFDSAQNLVGGRKLSHTKAEDISVTFNTGNYDEGYLRFDNNGTTTAGTQAALYFGDVSVKKGKSNNGWSPSLAELASSQDLKTAQSEFKQTTDAIKASVSSLDNSTVKSSSLTINSDGIVMKAGKSTTDVANAIGSYFGVNQHAINLFSDKINVKGNMIVNGAITSDKIASKQINTSHLNGKIITADVISSNAVTAGAIKAGAVTTDKMSANSINGDRIAAGTLDAAKIKAGSITASQIASGTITSNQIKAGGISSANIAAGAITTDKIAAGAIDANKIAANAITGDKIKANSVDVSKIVGIDANYLKAKIETAMIDWLKGKTIVADNGATKIDLLSGYINFDSDTPAVRRVTAGIPTQFVKFLKSDNNSVTTIGSNRDGSESSMNDSFAGIKITSGDLIEQTEIISDQIYFFTGAANRQGWQMTTVAGGDHRQVTLFPSGNPTKSNIYASDYFIRGSNGWVNLLDFIDYFNACLKHLQNHTGRYDIWKPFVI